MKSKFYNEAAIFIPVMCRDDRKRKKRGNRYLDVCIQSNDRKAGGIRNWLHLDLHDGSLFDITVDSPE